MSGYPCDQCDYKATVKNDLLRHIKSRHEGVKYPCNQCDYNTTQKTYYLLTHMKSKHKGVKYPCDQCDYKATQRYALSKHQNIWVSSILVINVILKQHRWRICWVVVPLSILPHIGPLNCCVYKQTNNMGNIKEIWLEENQKELGQRWPILLHIAPPSL